MNTTSYHNRWTALVADFNDARANQEALAVKHDQAETAYQAFRKTAPTRQITYAVEGFTHGPVTLDSYERTDTLDPHRVKHPSPNYAEHPDFLAYVEEVALWEESGSDLTAALKQADANWTAALGITCTAWREVATYPVGNFRELHEKLTLCRSAEWLNEEEAKLLLEHVAQDVARLTGCDVRTKAA